jgi:hypothetical protein
MTKKKSVESDPVYFTILPSKAGFTDQLYQFSVFYKLGLSLGYEYLHSKFISERDGAEDIYEFLGFNEHFSLRALTGKDRLYRLMGVNNYVNQKNISGLGKIKRYTKRLRFRVIKKVFFDEFNFVDVGIDDEPLDNENLEAIDYFQGLMQSVVSSKFKMGSKRKNVVRLHLIEGRYFFLKLAPLTCQKIPRFQDGLDLYATYLEHAEKYPVKPTFNEDKIKVEMQIRLGDTALIETPWHSFVPLWSGCPISPLVEYPDKSNKIFGHTMDVSDYFLFLKKFCSNFDFGDLSIAVFSDGYKTAFKELFRMIDDLKLSDEKMHALKEYVPTYEQGKFSIFDEIKNCVRVVGENNEALKELVHSSLIADVIIVGCNQNMISKLLVTYSDSETENPTIIIMLYRDKLPDYQIVLGEKAVIYPVNVNDLESDEGLVDVINEIKRLTVAPLTESTG